MASENDFGGTRIELGPGGSKLLKYRVISLNTNNSVLILAGAVKVHGWEITNSNASLRYVKLYDKATAPNVGTDVPTLTLAIPASGVPRSAEKAIGIPFTLGLGIGIVTGVADNDNTAVAAGEIIVHIFYS